MGKLPIISADNWAMTGTEMHKIFVTGSRDEYEQVSLDHHVDWTTVIMMTMYHIMLITLSEEYFKYGNFTDSDNYLQQNKFCTPYTNSLEPVNFNDEIYMSNNNKQMFYIQNEFLLYCQTVRNGNIDARICYIHFHI